MDANTISAPMHDLLVNYGQLAQATYDNLGINRCDESTYGKPLKPPGELLAYLDRNYPLAPSAPADKSPPGTNEMCARRRRSSGAQFHPFM
jgi:hypothetical protein